MILNAITEKLKRQSKDDFKGRHCEAWLIVQALTYYMRHPLSYRDLEELFRERGFQVDPSTINRWVHLPMRQPSRSGCASFSARIVVRSGSTRPTSRIRGKWRNLYRAIDKHGNPIDFLLAAKRELDAAKRFIRNMLKDRPLLSPRKIGTDGAHTFPSTTKTAVDDGFLHPNPVRYVTSKASRAITSG